MFSIVKLVFIIFLMVIVGSTAVAVGTILTVDDHNIKEDVAGRILRVVGTILLVVAGYTTFILVEKISIEYDHSQTCVGVDCTDDIHKPMCK